MWLWFSDDGGGERRNFSVDLGFWMHDLKHAHNCMQAVDSLACFALSLRVIGFQWNSCPEKAHVHTLFSPNLFLPLRIAIEQSTVECCVYITSAHCSSFCLTLCCRHLAKTVTKFHHSLIHSSPQKPFLLMVAHHCIWWPVFYYLPFCNGCFSLSNVPWSKSE